MLHSTKRKDQRRECHVYSCVWPDLTGAAAMGSYCHQPHGPCDHVYAVIASALDTPYSSPCADYYYYATAGGARIWVRELPPMYRCSWRLYLAYSGRSTSQPSRLYSSSSTCLSCTLPVSVTYPPVGAPQADSGVARQRTRTTPPATSLTGPASARAPGRSKLRCSAACCSRATWACSSSSTSRRTRSPRARRPSRTGRQTALRTVTGAFRVRVRARDGY